MLVFMPSLSVVISVMSIRILSSPIPPRWMKSSDQPDSAQSPQSMLFDFSSAFIPQTQWLLYIYSAITLIVYVAVVILQSLLILQSKGIVCPPDIALRSKFHVEMSQFWFNWRLLLVPSIIPYYRWWMPVLQFSILFVFCVFMWTTFVSWILMLVRSGGIKATATVFQPLGYLSLVMCILSALVFLSWTFRSELYTGFGTCSQSFWILGF